MIRSWDRIVVKKIERCLALHYHTENAFIYAIEALPDTAYDL
jgi:hypothetical protein